MKFFRKMYQKSGEQGGFTLVEMIVVLVIIAILAAITIPALLKYIDKAKDKQLVINARTAYLAAETAASEAYAANMTNIAGHTHTFTNASNATTDDPAKFCKNANSSVGACFKKNPDTGALEYGYYDLKSGKPMQVEVPSDQYEKAVLAMEKKIAKGQVPGVTDPSQAKELVRKS